MQETKWTPGPMTIRPVTHLLSMGEITYEASNPETGKFWSGQFLKREDAQLYAAARDLYEALSAMTVTFASPDYMQEWREKARKALAKARGEA